KSRRSLVALEELKSRDRPAVQTDFHCDQLLRRLDDLVHQRLVLDRKTNRRGGMVPTGIGIVSLSSAGKAPGAAYKQRIGRLYIEIGGGTAGRSSGGRFAGIPVLNSEEEFTV